MYSTLFTEFGIILVAATGIALIMRLMRQPLIIGHIITGVLVGPLLFNLIHSDEIFLLFSEMGIAFLLFIVGLNLNPRVLKDYGKTAIIAGVGQVAFTTLAGFLVSTWLGFNVVTSLYIGVALSFSSTIIILKLISDRGDLDKLYAKISIGFLLVQDLIVFALLFSLPLFTGDSISILSILTIFAKAILLVFLVIMTAKVVVMRMHPYLSRSSELLFLFATSWGLGIAVLFRELGFPLETGALVAGVALSLLPARHEINAKLSPLRDFFIVIFFVLLGSQINLMHIGAVLGAAAILSLLVLIGNPIILTAIMGVMGYRRKTSLQTGLTVAQVSEFSLILVALGVSLGHIDQSILSLVTLVGIVTIFGSTYLILYSDFWYRILKPYLKIFERRQTTEISEEIIPREIIIFGANRVGFDFIEKFRERGERMLVVDHDPEIIKQLQSQGVNQSFGDAGDPEFLDTINMTTAELIISTIPDLNTNLIIIRRGHRERPEIPIMVVAHSITNALKLYRAGASYVILPHFLGAEYASALAHRFASKTEDVETVRKNHISQLQHRIELGHEHPVVEKYR
ncbi:MAG: cation:proton antiporter [bacterium]